MVDGGWCPARAGSVALGAIDWEPSTGMIRIGSGYIIIFMTGYALG